MTTQTQSRYSHTKSQSFEEMTGSKLTEQQQMIMAVFAHPLVRRTREDIAMATNLKLASVCGRVRELMDAGQLVHRGERRDHMTNRNHELVGLPANG